jgi:hypothetical protein
MSLWFGTRSSKGRAEKKWRSEMIRTMTMIEGGLGRAYSALAWAIKKSRRVFDSKFVPLPQSHDVGGGILSRVPQSKLC